MIVRVTLIILCVAGVVFAEEDDSTLGPLVELLAQIDEPDAQLDILKGMHEGLRGRKAVPMPKGWSKLYAKLAKSPKKEVREQAQILALIFGDPQVLTALRNSVLDEKTSLEDRKQALNALIEKRVKDLTPTLLKLLEDKNFLSEALRGLAAYSDKSIPLKILEYYPKFTNDQKQDALQTLSSRPDYALTMLQAMKKGTVARQDLSAFTARQIQNLGNKVVIEQLRQVWGEVRQPTTDRKALIAKYQKMLNAKFLKQAKLPLGRVLFQKTCMQCHTLHGEGGKIGPDLTGSNRAELGYILENVLDPSALVGKDYQLTNVYTDSGRVISGIIVEKTDARMTVQTVNEKVIIANDEVDEIIVQPKSMMPDGLFDKLKPTEIRDLVAYLAAKQQVPLPPGTKAKE